MSGLGDAITEAVAEQEGKDPRLKKLEDLAKELHDEGVDFRVERGETYIGRDDGSTEAEINIDPQELGHLKLGLVSDVHLGSTYEQLSSLRDFYRIADEEGVDAFLNAGDFVQGTPKMHRGMEHELHVLSCEGQIGYAVDVYPHSDKTTYAITGNHDDSWINESGINVVRQISSQRDDIEYIGRDSCYLNIEGLRTYIVHPDGGASYAKSYKAQKLVEAIPEKERVQLVMMGHYHTYGVFKIQNTVCVMQPCFQGQYPWLVRKGLHPTIGGIILDIWYDETGVTRFSHTLIEYPEKSKDWCKDNSYKHSRPSVA